MTHTRQPKIAQYNPDAPRIGPGVYTLEDIRQRCRIDPVTDCWLWSLNIMQQPGVLHGMDQPRVSMPSGVVP
ncbi:MAG: hypothetical protein RIR00_1587, partial [Pseudomonadota bacterium]